MLRIADVSFKYAAAASKALDGVSLSARKGQHLLVMGPTGAGKSTLCMALRGLLGTAVEGELEGEIEIAGESVASFRAASHPVARMAPLAGLVFQDFERQLFSTNVVKEVAFGPENLNVPAGEVRRRVSWALDIVGLSGYEDRNPATLSGGEKQRLAIASVLSMRPRLLILDEPTTDLDPLGKEQIFALHERIAGQADLLVIVEHEIEPALHSERLVIMQAGRVAAEGSRELLMQPGLFESNSVQPFEPAVLASELGLDSMAEQDLRVALTAGPAARETPASGAEPRVARNARAVIALDRVSFAYGSKTLFEDLSVEITEGEFVALLGHNGCGKTTMAKLMAGLLRPRGGAVRVAGEDLARARFAWLASQIGYVFQNPDHQIFASTIAEEVAFGPRNMGWSEQETRARVATVLQRVGLAGQDQVDPFTLPKGSRQRIAVASVLVMEPRILILDEPTTGLDLAGCRAILGLLADLNRAGHTILIITHSMRAALEYADRTIVMKQGRLVADGPSADIFYGDALNAAGLRPPPIVALGKMAGVRARSAGELLRSLSGDPRGCCASA
ncbi:MAG: energy-coupling factor transporter ATPase [Acidobacteriota bacterium]